MQELNLVYLAAGMSSRFNGKVKQLIKVGPKEETLIEVSIAQALDAQITSIIFIVGEKTEYSFKEKFGSFYKGIPVKYVKQSFDISQRDKPWGTAEAVSSILPIINGPSIVCNGDDLYGSDAYTILKQHVKHSNDSALAGYLLADVLPQEGEVNRGIVSVDHNNHVQAIEENYKLSKGNYQERGLTNKSICSMNFFLFQKDAIQLLKERVEAFKLVHKDNRTIECLLPQQVSELLQAKQITMKSYAAKNEWIGVTNPADEEIVRNYLRNADLNTSKSE